VERVTAEEDSDYIRVRVSMEGYKPCRLQSRRGRRKHRPTWLSAWLCRLGFSPLLLCGLNRTEFTMRSCRLKHQSSTGVGPGFSKLGIQFPNLEPPSLPSFVSLFASLVPLLSFSFPFRCRNYMMGLNFI